MPIITTQKLIDADKDADSLNTFISGSDFEDVITRLNKVYPTLANVIRQIMSIGGAVGFETLAELEAYIPEKPYLLAYVAETGRFYTHTKEGGWKDGALYSNETYLHEIIGIKESIAGIYSTNTTMQFPFVNNGRAYKDGRIDEVKFPTNQYVDVYKNTGFIKLRKGDKVSCRVRREQNDVSYFSIYNIDLTFRESRDLEFIEVSAENGGEVTYKYIAEDACFAVFTTISWDNAETAARSAKVLKETADAKNLTKLYMPTERILDALNDRFIDTNDYAFIPTSNGITETGEHFQQAYLYKNTGFIKVRKGGTLTATISAWETGGFMSALNLYDMNKNFIKCVHTIREFGTSNPNPTIEFIAEEDCYVIVTSIRFGGDDAKVSFKFGEVLDVELNAIRIISALNEYVKDSNDYSFLSESTGIDENGAIFGGVDVYYKNTDFIYLNQGETITATIAAWETGGFMSALNLYDMNKNFIKCLYTIRQFGANNDPNPTFKYTAEKDCHVIVTSIRYGGEDAVVSLNKHLPWGDVKQQEVDVSSNIIYPELIVAPKPTSLIKIELKSNSAIPSTKADGVIDGEVTINIDGKFFSSFVGFSVQGDSSAAFAKKNLSLDFFVDEEHKTERKIKLGNLQPHETLVFKANWIDATHSRNIVTNNLWEEIVQTRKGFPKREVDVTYVGAKGVGSIDTGALGHATGYPCVMYFNNQFYGIGTLNIHKKRGNYNLEKDNKKHIQFCPAGNGVEFVGPINTTLLELRNPKIKGYKEGDEITDKTVRASLDRLWAYNSLPLDERKAKFDQYYDRVNAADWVILVQFAAAADLLQKNTMYTTYDGNKWFILPFDLDTTYGLNFDGNGLGYDTNWNWDSWSILGLIQETILDDVKRRYAELRKSGLLSVDSVYRLNRDIESKFSTELVKLEQSKWPEIPSKDFGGIYQVTSWIKDRLKYLDAKYDYLDDRVLAQKLFDPPRLEAGAESKTTFNLASAKIGDQFIVDFSLDLQSTIMTAGVLKDGVVIVTHKNTSTVFVNLTEGALRLLSA